MRSTVWLLANISPVSHSSPAVIIAHICASQNGGRGASIYAHLAKGSQLNIVADKDGCDGAKDEHNMRQEFSKTSLKFQGISRLFTNYMTYLSHS